MGEEMRAVVKVPVATLSSRKTIPLLGFGTAAYPFVGSDGVTSAILKAIKLGYRHFDTAALYMTEESLGDAIAEALQLGLIRSRDEVFITSKLYCCDAHPDRVLAALQNTLKNLKMEYLDLYLIHWPARVNPGNFTFPPAKEELLPIDYENVWSAMEECQKLGLTKSIGVSNFSCKKLQSLLAIANIPPAVNQVELNPIWQQTKLIKFCKANDIVVTAYSPLGANGTPWGSSGVADTQVLHEIAKARGKTHAQVCLKWVYQQGVSVLVKSFNEDRMEENLTLFDWELNEDELKKIGEIRQRRGLPGDFFVSDNGPFKSVEDLWDGEV